IEGIEVGEGAGQAKNDLSFVMEQVGNELRGTLEFAAAIYERETAERMAGHLVQVLEGVSTDPECRLCLVEILTPAEHHELLHQATNRQPDLPFVSVQDLITRTVERLPDVIAIESDREQLSFAELKH